MKFFLTVFILIFNLFAFATETKVAEKKDFSVICAASSAAKSLLKDKHITDKAERLVLAWNIVEQNVKTEDVKNVVKTVLAADPSQKIKLMKQGAADVGLLRWKCNTLKYLF